MIDFPNDDDKDGYNEEGDEDETVEHICSIVDKKFCSGCRLTSSSVRNGDANGFVDGSDEAHGDPAAHETIIRQFGLSDQALIDLTVKHARPKTVAMKDLVVPGGFKLDLTAESLWTEDPTAEDAGNHVPFGFKPNSNPDACLTDSLTAVDFDKDPGIGAGFGLSNAVFPEHNREGAATTPAQMDGTYLSCIACGPRPDIDAFRNTEALAREVPHPHDHTERENCNKR